MKKDVKEVLDKISSGNYNPEEETIAKLWLHQLHQNDEAGISEQELHEISNQMWLSLEPNKKQPQLNKYRKLVVYMAAAASLALIIGVGLYFNQPPPLSKSIQAKAFANDIPAGSNKAYLTLANGKKLALTNSANGTLAEEAGIKITKTADGQLVYTIADQGEKGIAGYNSIETPRGGQYQLNLPDGTKIWINSASSLKYPASFASLKERRVELSGEAYFEVAKDKTHPFIVKSGRQEIQVLGTHFDVNAYPDEQLIKTTLLEGSVKLNKQVVLKPGEQSSLTGEKFTVKAVNVNDAVDWKNGEFVFTNESLTSILKKVSRWYDVEIKYVRTPANMPTFTGSVSRSENISGVLKMLEETSNVRFSIEGKQVSVITK